jgi:hypothetical protein
MIVATAFFTAMEVLIDRNTGDAVIVTSMCSHYYSAGYQ